MIEIKKVSEEDKERIEFVCRNTAGEKSRTEELTGKIVYKTYSSYYAREEVENCFGLYDDGVLVGYILCAPDANKFKRIFRKKDVKEIMSLNKKSGVFAWVLPIPYMLLKGKYPAHLHIDLLDDYQNKGYGSKMLNLLLNHLAENGVKGVMLMTDSDNFGAIRFYERHGFKILITAFGGVVMGRSLK